MYKSKKIVCYSSVAFVAASMLSISSTAFSATLGQRAVYEIRVLGRDAAENPPVTPAAGELGQCSAFTFGDVSTICATGSPSVFVDSEVTAAPALAGGDGVAGDGLAGKITIQTGRADAAGNNTFTVTSYQMDPYLGTAGGVFKTSMTPPDGSLTGAGGTVDAQGNMTLDLIGRVGVAQFFESSLGVLPWNLDDSTKVLGTGVTQGFTTGDSTNFDPTVVPPAATPNLTLTGRAIGDVDTDGVLDAILVSVGNVGSQWGFFDGTPYSEALNVQFVLVSADPVAAGDTVITTQGSPVTIDVAADLLANDTHAAGETLVFDSFAQPADAGSSVTDNGDGTLTYTPNVSLSGVGVDSFTYTVRDAGGQTDTATVTINVASGSPPVANNDNVTVQEDGSLTLDPVAGSAQTTGVVDDSDPDAGQTATLAITAFDTVSANSATVTATSGGNNLTYTPPPNFNGADSFTYTIQDSTGFTSTATVNVNVAAVNDVPVCSDVSFTVAVDKTLSIDVATELLSTTSVPPLCADIEGDALSLGAFDATGTSGGTITSSGGTLTYTPPSGFEGQDTFTFTAFDGTDQAVANTVTVNVANPTLGNFTMLDAQGNTFGGTNDVLFEWDGKTFNADDKDTTTVATMRSVGSASEPDGHKFFGSPWTAHHIRIFKPGTYTFDTTCNKADMDAGITDCNRSFNNPDQTEKYLTVTVGQDQIGALIFFDYTVTEDIDVFLVWDQNKPWDRLGEVDPSRKNKLFTGEAGVPPDEETTWELVSTDGDGDGIVGVAMIDGSFIGFSANFNIGPGGSAPPPPPITTQVGDTSLGGASVGLWGMVTVLLSALGFRRFSKKEVNR